MADCVGVVLGASGYSRYWRRVMAFADGRSTQTRRVTDSLKDKPEYQRRACALACARATNPSPASQMAASLRLLAARCATAFVHVKDRGCGHMPTSFDVMFLGTLVRIDTVQGDEVSETAGNILGSWAQSTLRSASRSATSRRNG